MKPYTYPGVYVEEISTLPPSVAPLSTAVPVFIGNTEKAGGSGNPLLNQAVRITSFVEYSRLFGGPPLTNIRVQVDEDGLPERLEVTPNFNRMYYQVYMYFQNGGGPCYIISVGLDTGGIGLSTLETGLQVARKVDEITLIVLPDVEGLPTTDDYYDAYQRALAQCAALKDRFSIIDVKAGTNAVQTFRQSSTLGNENLDFGAAYYPYLKTTLRYHFERTTIASGESVTVNTLSLVREGTDLSPDEADEMISRSDFKAALGRLIAQTPVTLPPSGAIAGVYVSIDRTRGVFKAPANVGLAGVIAPEEMITDEEQSGMNVDSSGKSVNAIRSFTGKGTLIWGARTLDGNSNEWRYVPVRRFFLFVEESLKKATEGFVFEPNDANTWNRIKGMAENFLLQQWRAGALQGSVQQQAFQVRVGLGETMTAQDVLEGLLIVEIGLAVVRPSEFIVLRFTHQLPEA